MTNRPNSVISSTVLPGISDHDAPQIEIDVQPVRTAQIPRQIPNYKKADWDGFKTFMRSRGDSIITSPPDTDTEELWNKFRDSLLEGINVFIPHKSAKARRGLPYISRDIRQLIRKRDRLYDKIKKTSKNVYLHHIAAEQKLRYKKVKHEVQKRIRQAYWAYVASVITPEKAGAPPQKAFWSFVKRNRTEKVQIGSLLSQTTGELATNPTDKANILNQ